MIFPLAVDQVKRTARVIFWYGHSGIGPAVAKHVTPPPCKAQVPSLYQYAGIQAPIYSRSTECKAYTCDFLAGTDPSTTSRFAVRAASICARLITSGCAKRTTVC